MPAETAVSEDAQALTEGLAQDIESWLRKWSTLGERLRSLTAFCVGLAADHPDRPIAERLLVDLEAPTARFGAGQLCMSDVPPLLALCREYEVSIVTLPGWDQPNRVYGGLHGLVNALNGLRVSQANVTARCAVIDAAIGRDRLPEPLICELSRSLGRDAALSEALAQAVLSALPHIPAVPPPRARMIDSTKPEDLASDIAIVVVEDDPVWWPDTVRVAEDVAGNCHPDGRTISVHSRQTYDEGHELLRRYGSQGTSSTAVVLVLDLGLPRDAAELDLVQVDRATIGRQWGRELLRMATAYRQRYRVIIFTADSAYGADLEAALSCGIRPDHFIVKSPEGLSELKSALYSLVVPQRAPLLEILTGTGCRVRLDGFEIDLEPTPFRTLSALAYDPHHAASVDEVADRLHDLYGEEYNRHADAEACVDEARSLAARDGLQTGSVAYNRRVTELLRGLMAPANALEAWQRATRTHGHAVVGASAMRKCLEAFWRNCRDYEGAQPWAWFARTIGTKESHADRGPSAWTDDEVISIYRAATRRLRKGHIETRAFDPETIHDHIYTLRTSFYQATTVDPERFVIATESGPDGYRYRLVADPVLHSGAWQPASSLLLSADERCRVLVVENDPLWSTEVCTVLEGCRYDVRLSQTLEEASSLAEEFRPHILCLDLHLPRNADELRQWKKDGTAGKPTGGLDVLNQVHTSQPRVKAVILSGLAEDAEVRLSATRLGIPIHAIVPKEQPKEGLWRDTLLRAVWTCEQELRRGVVLPSSNYEVPFVAVELEDRGNRDRGIHVTSGSSHEGRWVPLGLKESQLLRLLGSSGGRPIDRDDLAEGLYGEEWPDKGEALDQVLKRVREAIVKHGLGLAGREARRVGALLIGELAGVYVTRFKFAETNKGAS